jgi:integrase
MPTVKLTDAAVRRLTAPKNARIDYFDAAFPGLALRVTGGNDRRPDRRTWTFFYRLHGKQRRLTFEPGYPALSLADARQQATEAQLQIKAGVDPAATKLAAKEQAARAPDTMANVVDQFVRLDLERRKRAPQYINGTRRIFENHVLPHWKDRDIKSITRRDVIELLDAVMEEGTPIAANRTLAAIRALFNWALRRDMIESTPAALVERPGEEVRRERTLTADEIKAVWAAATEVGYPFGQFFQFALLTGQRRDEVARMRWSDVDFDTKLWTLPAEATKPGRTHVVALAPLAIDILKTLPRIARSSCVFTSNGNAPISGFSKAKIRLDEAMAKADDGQAVEPFTIHDLRRTAATEMGRLGISQFVVGKVLNHADRSVTGIYNRYDYINEKRHALDTWAAYLTSLTSPPAGNVVALRQAAAQ